jgi:hypothetical protein
MQPTRRQSSSRSAARAAVEKLGANLRAEIFSNMRDVPVADAHHLNESDLGYVRRDLHG